jgi:hypothetical protein
MNIFTKIAIGLVLLAAAYFGYVYFTGDETPLPAGDSAAQVSQQVEVTKETISESSDEYTINIEYPQFGIPTADVYIEEAMRESADAIIAQAATDTPVAQGFRKYELFGTTQSTYVGEDLVSARVVLSQDFGGAHPLPIVTTYNFYRSTGALITLEDVLGMIGKTLDQVAGESLVQLNAQLGADIIAPEGASADAANYQTFVIDGSSVTFIFQPYQVAPYAAGAPEVPFPRKQ